MDNNELMHYGVLGMKWGVRRTEARLARTQKKVDKLKAKKKVADRLERAKKKLSDAENKEKMLKDHLSKKGASSKSKPEKSGSKGKTIKDLSDAELKEKVARLDLEKRYRDLASSVNPPKSTKGKDFVTGILENSGKNIGGQLTTYVMGTAVNKLLKDMFGDDAIINPKKGQKDK